MGPRLRVEDSRVCRSRRAHCQLRCHGDALHRPGFFAAPGRRLFFLPRGIARGVERREALPSVDALRRHALGEGRTPPGAPRAAFFDPGPRFPGHSRPDQPAPGGGICSVPQAEPRAAPGQGYEPCPEEPHPAPPSQRLATTPSGGRDGRNLIHNRNIVKRRVKVVGQFQRITILRGPRAYSA